MIHHLKKVHPTTWLKAGIGFLLGAILLFLIPYGAILQWLTFENVVEWVKHAQSNNFTLLIFFVAFTLGVLGLPITLFPIVGGVLFDYWIAFPVNLAAATLGSWLAYAIARFFGRETVEKMLRGRLKAFDEKTAEKGILTVAIIRWVGVPPFIVSNYALGLSGISSKDFLIGTIIGLGPWTALITYLATTFWQAALEGGEKGLMSTVVRTMWPLVALSFLAVGGILTKWWLDRKKKPVVDYSNL
jgi:uncharacterized membrane protein YdjX (TVP38/TMEM64 family)